jgi:predicted membrane protein
MILERISLSRTTIMFVVILYKQFQREICQKTLKVVGKSTFWIKVMKVEFMFVKNLQEILISSKTINKSVPIISKKSSKNLAIKLFDPRILSFLKLEIGT